MEPSMLHFLPCISLGTTKFTLLSIIPNDLNCIVNFLEQKRHVMLELDILGIFFKKVNYSLTGKNNIN